MGETVTMTLTEFLLARIDADEAMASDLDEVWLREYVLAECVAKRRIVALHAASADRDECDLCVTFINVVCGEWEAEKFPCPTVRAIASVYADHPDYDKVWAVD